MDRAPSGRRTGSLLLVLVVLGAALVIVASRPADAYEGAPWFEPGKPYNQNFPDPSIVVHDGTYYAFSGATGGNYLPVMTSSDAATWTARPAYDPGAPLNRDRFFNDALPYPAKWGVDRPGAGSRAKDVWAPGVELIGGRWLAFYALRTRLDRDRFCISVAIASNPLGPYTDNSSGPMVCDDDPNGSIDPQPFVDDDGTPYLLWKSEGVPGARPTRLWSRRLDPSGTRFAAGTTPVKLLETSQAWEGNVIENPTMVRHGGRLFLLYSGNEHQSARYAIGAATCASPSGPCQKAGNNPLLASQGDRLGPGGPTVFHDTSGALRMGYHWWNAPYSSYPSDPGCDGTDPKTGRPYCVSQGQRRMSVAYLAVVDGRLTITNGPRPPPPPPRGIDRGCPRSRVTPAGFVDVSPIDIHAFPIDCVVWWGVANGVSTGRYEPGRSVTRGQMASFIARLLDEAGVPLPTSPRNAFGDDDRSVHARNIDRLAAAGVVTGRADGSYGPSLRVDRAQMATFLVRAAGVAGVQLRGDRDVFPDDDGSVHEPNIDAAAVAGLTGGRSDGTYGPTSSVLRSQMASFLARMLDLLVEERITPAR